MPHSLAPYPDKEPLMDVERLIDEEVPSPLGVQFPEPSFSNSLLPDTGPPAPATQPQSVDQPEIASPRVERPHVHSTLPTRNSTSRRQRSCRMRRDERVPRWAYDLEERRIAAEQRLASAEERHASVMEALVERHTAAMEALVERHTAAMEAIVELMREIRDDFRSYISGSSRQQT